MHGPPIKSGVKVAISGVTVAKSGMTVTSGTTVVVVLLRLDPRTQGSAGTCISGVRP